MATIGRQSSSPCRLLNTAVAHAVVSLKMRTSGPNAWTTTTPFARSNSDSRTGGFTATASRTLSPRRIR